MAINCNIIVEDDHYKIKLFRRWNCYPDVVLPELQMALPFAWSLPRFEATDFAAAIVRAWKEIGGGDIRIMGSHQGWSTISAGVGWVYLIKAENITEPSPTSPEPASEVFVEVYTAEAIDLAISHGNKAQPVPSIRVDLTEIHKMIPDL